MSLKDVTPGTYYGRATDYGLEEVEKLKQLKAFVMFEFKDNTGNAQRIKWDGFLTKKDGELNKKTMDTLIACGFKGKSITDLNVKGSLNETKEMMLTLEYDEAGKYLRCEWVNDPSESSTQKVTDVKKLNGFDLSRVDSYLKLNQTATPVKAPLKNHAPGAENPPEMPDEELPF